MKSIYLATGVALLFFSSLSTTDHLLQSSQEIQRVQQIEQGVQNFSHLMKSLYNTQDFPKIHADYWKNLLYDPQLKYYLDQWIQKDFHAHMHSEIAQYCAWQTTRDTRKYFRYYDYDIKPIVIGLTLISIGCLLYEKTDLEIQESEYLNFEILKLSCIPIFWGLGYFALKSGIHPSNTIMKRLHQLDKNYSVLYPTSREHLSNLVIHDKFTTTRNS